MESRVEDIVIVGAGIAGLATSLGLHRLGVRSLVLESSNTLRTSGFALSIWTNAWKALDVLGIGHILRQEHLQLLGNVTTSLITGQQTSTTAFVNATGKHGVHEVRRVRRQLLLEVLANELPSGTIRYSSKVVAIEESGFTKLIHLADGTIIRTKVLIGCDGVNSIVAKWLGLNKAAFSGRFGIRGCITLKNSHKLEPLFMQFFGKGYRNGVMPCDDKTVHWFFNWTPTCQEKKLEENPAQMKQFVLEKLKNMPSDIRAFIENTDLDHFLSSPLRYRHPWELVFGNINKSNVCVAGDAFHPMTPDLGQGGCCALEDGIVLARCLGEVFSMKSSRDIRKKDNEEEEEEQYKKIEMSLKKYANERRWRSIIIISAAYMTGVIQQGQSKLVSFFRDKFFTPILAGFLLKASDFDCGKLSNF
ncbi:monooxygenase 2-like isoform X1 [Prosopis cineraria]|uniref:monooxygenase 2-like isoform X1 n=1 Tax=Prosopis cineraria TaxID=364024 RepID=UPI0024108C2F|nr:monooxygenase 2-like isoform X1 [Prosopis cineraria]